MIIRSADKHLQNTPAKCSTYVTLQDDNMGETSTHIGRIHTFASHPAGVEIQQYLNNCYIVDKGHQNLSINDYENDI